MLVLFYGSLKRGGYNHYRLNVSQSGMFVANAVTREPYFMASFGSYPAVMVPTKEFPGELIHGELWEMPAEAMEPIRRMEIGAGYEEKSIMVETKEGSNTALVYIHKGVPSSTYKEVVGGLWDATGKNN